MKDSRNFKVLAYLAISIALVIVDQACKLLARKYLKPIGSMPLIKGILDLRYTTNTGASFGLFMGNSRLLGLFSLVACIAISAFGFHEIRRYPEKWPYLLSLAFILAGAAGNMIDRLFRGYVIDFLDFAFMRFAVFNVADSCICIGAAMLCVYLLFDKELFGSQSGTQ